MNTVSDKKDTVHFDANDGTNGTVFTLPADGEYMYNATMACETGKTKTSVRCSMMHCTEGLNNV